MLAIVFIPHVPHFSEETMALAQYFTQREVESMVDGDFEAKERVLAFLSEVRARSPSLFRQLVGSDCFGDLIETIKEMASDDSGESDQECEGMEED
jgi:hypothetical protein